MGLASIHPHLRTGERHGIAAGVGDGAAIQSPILDRVVSIGIRGSISSDGSLLYAIGVRFAVTIIPVQAAKGVGIAIPGECRTRHSRPIAAFDLAVQVQGQVSIIVTDSALPILPDLGAGDADLRQRINESRGAGKVFVDRHRAVLIPGPVAAPLEVDVDTAADDTEAIDPVARRRIVAGHAGNKHGRGVETQSAEKSALFIGCSGPLGPDQIGTALLDVDKDQIRLVFHIEPAHQFVAGVGRFELWIIQRIDRLLRDRRGIGISLRQNLLRRIGVVFARGQIEDRNVDELIRPFAGIGMGPDGRIGWQIRRQGDQRRPSCAVLRHQAALASAAPLQLDLQRAGPSTVLPGLGALIVRGRIVAFGGFVDQRGNVSSVIGGVAGKHPPGRIFFRPDIIDELSPIVYRLIRGRPGPTLRCSQRVISHGVIHDVTALDALSEQMHLQFAGDNVGGAALPFLLDGKADHLLPLGIDLVLRDSPRPVDVDEHLRYGPFGAVFVQIPTQELVAAGDLGSRYVAQIDGAVVEHVLNGFRILLRCDRCGADTEVGIVPVIRQRHYRIIRLIDCRERHIRVVDMHQIAGHVDLVADLPADEVLTRRRREPVAGEDDARGVGQIVRAVRHRAAAFAGIIVDVIIRAGRIDSHEGHVAVDRRGEVPGQAVIGPVKEGGAFQIGVVAGAGHLGAVVDLYGGLAGKGAAGGVEGHGMLDGLPLGVDRHVPARHFPRGEIHRAAGEGRVVIPAFELVRHAVAVHDPRDAGRVGVAVRVLDLVFVIVERILIGDARHGREGDAEGRLRIQGEAVARIEQTHDLREFVLLPGRHAAGRIFIIALLHDNKGVGIIDIARHGIVAPYAQREGRARLFQYAVGIAAYDDKRPRVKLPVSSLEGPVGGVMVRALSGGFDGLVIAETVKIAS